MTQDSEIRLLTYDPQPKFLPERLEPEVLRFMRKEPEKYFPVPATTIAEKTSFTYDELEAMRRKERIFVDPFILTRFNIMDIREFRWNSIGRKRRIIYIMLFIIMVIGSLPWTRTTMQCGVTTHKAIPLSLN